MHFNCRWCSDFCNNDGSHAYEFSKGTSCQSDQKRSRRRLKLTAVAVRTDLRQVVCFYSGSSLWVLWQLNNYRKGKQLMRRLDTRRMWSQAEWSLSVNRLDRGSDLWKCMIRNAEYRLEFIRPRTVHRFFINLGFNASQCWSVSEMQNLLLLTQYDGIAHTHNPRGVCCGKFRLMMMCKMIQDLTLPFRW